MARSIFLIRAEMVMLDSDLAELHGVETKCLNEQVRRNRNRFPPELKFQLTLAKFKHLTSQMAVSSSHGGRRHLPSSLPNTAR